MVVSLNSRLESNKEEKKKGSGWDLPPHRAGLGERARGRDGERERGREGERERGREGERERGREGERERGGRYLSPHRAGAQGAEVVQEFAGSVGSV